MHLVVAGLNHRTAPVELRERAAISERRIPEMLRAAVAQPGVIEAVILSTCNRAEIYASIEAEAPRAGEEVLTAFMSSACAGVPVSQLSGHLYCYRDERASDHLMRVAAGLDSMILGESQILGQVKSAYAAAQEAGCTGPLLNTLFQSALAVGKRVRTETEVGHGAFSVGAAAVELANRIFGDTLSGKTVLVLGAGKMSELTARHLQACGDPTVLVTNRTHERAAALAGQLGEGASARSYDTLSQSLVESDIVICSTSAPHPVVTREAIQAAMKARRNRPLFLIDIAVPRDVEPDVASLENVYLYNIDDLSEVVQRDTAKRRGEMDRAEAIVDEGVAQFQAWRRSLEAVPLVTAVRERLDGLKLEEMARVRTRLTHLSERDLKVVEAALHSVTGKVAHDAITAIKEAAGEGGDPSAYDRLDAIRSAFGLSAAAEQPHRSTADAAGSESPASGAKDAAQRAVETA